MKGKKIKLLYLIILLLFLASSSTRGHAETMVVTSFDDIQQIIDDADPYSTLIFEEGEYNQRFEITKPLKILGKDANKTIIDMSTEKNKPIITISSPNVSISNITIKNTGPGLYASGIRIIGKETTLNNCKFLDTPIGVSIWSDSNIINNCLFINCSDEGIVLLSTILSTANNNLIENCTFENNCDGIELQQSCNNTIKFCILNNNYHSGIDGISNNNNYNLILNCTITNNSVHGIYLTNSHDNLIKNCVFYNNTDGNIITPRSNNTTVQNNIFEEYFIIDDYSSDISDNTIDKTREKNHVMIDVIINFVKQISNFFSNI